MVVLVRLVVRRGILVLLVLQMLLLLMVVAGHGGGGTAAGAVEMVLVDEVVLMVLGGDGGRGKSVGAEIVTRQVLPVVVGSGVVDVLNLIAAAALLTNTRKPYKTNGLVVSFCAGGFL